MADTITRMLLLVTSSLYECFNIMLSNINHISSSYFYISFLSIRCVSLCTSQDINLIGFSLSDKVSLYRIWYSCKWIGVFRKGRRIVFWEQQALYKVGTCRVVNSKCKAGTMQCNAMIWNIFISAYYVHRRHVLGHYMWLSFLLCLQQVSADRYL